MRRNYDGVGLICPAIAAVLIIAGGIAEPLLAVLGLLMLAVDVIIYVMEYVRHEQKHKEHKKEKEGKAIYESIGNGRQGPVGI